MKFSISVRRPEDEPNGFVHCRSPRPLWLFPISSWNGHSLGPASDIIFPIIPAICSGRSEIPLKPAIAIWFHILVAMFSPCIVFGCGGGEPLTIPWSLQIWPNSGELTKLTKTEYRDSPLRIRFNQKSLPLESALRPIIALYIISTKSSSLKLRLNISVLNIKSYAITAPVLLPFLRAFVQKARPAESGSLSRVVRYIRVTNTRIWAPGGGVYVPRTMPASLQRKSNSGEITKSANTFSRGIPEYNWFNQKSLPLESGGRSISAT
jgi:hypothetical protein